MRIRTLTAAFVVSAVATLPLAGIAAASDGDATCASFSSQAAAQKALDEGLSNQLDSDGDGKACESSSKDDDKDKKKDKDKDDDKDKKKDDDEDDDDKKKDDDDDQVKTKPKGGVETGDGSSPVDPSALIVIAGLGALGVGATVRIAARQSN